jgi:hypothetical protein
MITSSVDNILPQDFIFLTKVFHDSLMYVATPGSLWLVNIPQSSCIT